jgi:crotonobetainyl-CoA:carnitine CoA-transferase CaiB-like acyl-CoA transferase
MMDGAVSWQVINVINQLAQGTPQTRGATMLTGEHPCYALYETKDGRWVTVGALEPHFWRNLCQELGLEDLIPQQFSGGAARDDAFRRVRAKFKEKTMSEWVSLLADKDICFGPVASVDEMLDDPQARHRQMVVEQADRRGETRRTLGNPLKLSATPPTLRTPPPDFGAHTDEVLATLGYTAGDVVALRSRGIV